MQLIQGKKYIIEWIDTFTYTGWWEEEEIKEKSTEMKKYIVTVAFYVGEDKYFSFFASQVNHTPRFAKWGHVLWIPKGCISSAKKL